MAGSSASVNSQVSRASKRKWTLSEDVALVSCMVELRNLGSFNADTGFKSGYLHELEKMLAVKLPDCGLKAKPHIESRLKTLKKEWSIVYDMMYGPHTSGFGWDDSRKMVTAENAVWDAYIASHKEAAPFKTRSIQFFEELSLIYAKDRATGKDAQGADDIIEEMDLEDARTEREEREEGQRPVASADATIPVEMSHACPSSVPTIGGGSASSGRKRKHRFDYTPLQEAMNEIGNKIEGACAMLSKSVHSDLVQEKLLEFPRALREVDGLTEAERRRAIRKFGKNPTQVLLFFGCEPEDRLDMVKDFIQDD